MKRFQQLCKASIALSLVLFTLAIAVFGLTPASGAAASPVMSSPLSYSSVFLNLGNRTGASAQNLEGQAQEAYGNITGNRQAQFQGRAKQTASQVRNAAEDVKSSEPGNRLESGFKSVTGKVQETIGNITGNTEMQVEGKAKQAEGGVRNAVEDAKAGIRNALD